MSLVALRNKLLAAQQWLKYADNYQASPKYVVYKPNSVEF